MEVFFTRLTSNLNYWKNPSGQDGKCQALNALRPLYEESNHFGWEEWLFEDYHLKKDDPEFQCRGFLQAFNQKNRQKKRVDRIHLYSKFCANNNRITHGCYYVGYVDNVTRIEYSPKEASDVARDLRAAEIFVDSFQSMLPFAKNISFKVKDVHVRFNNITNQPIELNRGQFRFALYSMNSHQNFQEAIKKYQ